LMNLIVNAAHAISDIVGDGANGKGVITISSRKVDNYVIITVQDTGAGIPDNIKNRIFDPFFTTKKVGKGTGQGLSIVYDIIVRKHNGSISFESKPGEGTIFTINLPVDVE
jgi:two-component system, NtrC family, sensor kinase